MDLVIERLVPERRDDLLTFFDRDAFGDNPWWAGCYCTHYEKPGEYTVPDPSTPAYRDYRDGNRAMKSARVSAGAASGFLAYRDGRVVGWLNAQPKRSYVNAHGFAPAFADAPDGTGMIMCFVVAPDERGKGVGAALLRAAVDGFAQAGLRHAQGYAKRADAPREPWETFATSNYHGTTSMYADAGFTEVGSVGHYAIMRRAL